MAIKLASLDELKLFAEKEAAISSDELLENIIEYVSASFETYLNRELKKEQRNKYFDSGQARCFLPAYPVDSAATLTVVYSGITQTIDSDYYLWPDEGIIEFYVRTLYTEPKEIQITWTGGYVEEDEVLQVPSDLRYACVVQSLFTFKMRRHLGVTYAQLPNGALTVNTPNAFLPEVKRILNLYRSFRV